MSSVHLLFCQGSGKLLSEVCCPARASTRTFFSNSPIQIWGTSSYPHVTVKLSITQHLWGKPVVTSRSLDSAEKSSVSDEKSMVYKEHANFCPSVFKYQKIKRWKKQKPMSRKALSCPKEQEGCPYIRGTFGRWRHNLCTT